MDEPKITYLLGAGASANSIPVVAGFTGALLNFVESINKFSLPDGQFEDIDEQIEFTKHQVRDEMYRQCKALIAEANKHVTVDTYARKLFLTGRRKDLRRLKALISIFLIDWQLKYHPDQRYDVFFATLLDKKGIEPSLPNSINIITWNYDFQLEKAIAPFLPFTEIEAVQRKLNVYPNNDEKLSENDFRVIKLNGTASGWYGKNGEYTNIQLDLGLDPGVFETAKYNIWEGYLSFYYWSTHDHHNSTFALTFAWELDSYSKKLRDSTFQLIKDTTILVIIGYSFPTFNRNLDKEILRQMIRLRKIIIQTMQESADEVEHRFRSLITKKRLEEVTADGKPKVELEIITMKGGKEEFYIPFEFTGQ